MRISRSMAFVDAVVGSASRIPIMPGALTIS
jgi:hypothetical protein